MIIVLETRVNVLRESIQVQIYYVYSYMLRFTYRYRNRDIPTAVENGSSHRFGMIVGTYLCI